MTEYDVVIAGYGPTGAVAANLLGQQGVRVLVVEPSREVFDVPRAVHFDGEVMRIFQSLGLAADIERISAPGTALGFTNGRNWNLLEQDLTRVPRKHGWANSHFFNQPALEQLLRVRGEGYPSVDVCLGASVTGIEQTHDKVIVQIVTTEDSTEADGEAQRQVHTKYLFGCDGASSTVRRTLGIEQEDLGCDEPWLVCDWILPPGTPINRRAYQICDPRRPTTLVPGEGEHVRWEFMVNPGESEQVLEDEDLVRGMMAPHVHRLSSELTADMGELIRAKVYTFHALLSQSFQRDRVFLLGDAAHQTPPFLGQGMCAGIRDAHNLCWKLVGVLDGHYADTILESYTTERRPHVLNVIATAVRHGGVIQNRSHALAFVRDCYLKLGRLFPALVRFLRFDISWALGPGLFDSRQPRGSKTPVGQPFPQFAGSDAELGRHFTLVTRDEATCAAAKTHSCQINVKCLTIEALTNHIDAMRHFQYWFAQHSALAVLVRPDRHVYGYCHEDEDAQQRIDQLLRQLGEQLVRA